MGALRSLREQAGYKITEAAKEAGFSQAKLSDIEALKSGVTGDDTHALCQLYGADEATTDALVQLARQARRRDWWAVYNDDVLGSFSGFIELEDDAREISEFEADVIPGQLQTEAYASTVIGRLAPDLDADTIKQRVKLRMDRQQRARDRGSELWVVIGEGALRQATGGHAVMAEQLDHLKELAAKPGITVQVLPHSNLGHSAMGVPFTLITLRDGARYVYIEVIPGGVYMEDSRDIDQFASTWTRLQATALDLDRSATMIGRIAHEHRSSVEDYD
ncbi:helix-turn-helix domain-containing protein [Tamaricihabitans halophyticus]|uniref:helix-turn-helix domain-containing protein n=1 Tax=Tamaricihabitans halophyticus TaxID=1262583 RepID=UPI001FB2FFDC|nr:helix-turn-helix transcriptional regulator [Tamaricihabitans halophyticus]